MFILFSNRLRQKFITHKPVVMFYQFLLLLILFMVAFAMLFKLFEHDKSWVESIWQAWQTVSTVGFGNGPAETTFGILMTMILGTVGIFSLGVVFSLYRDMKEHFILRRVAGLSKNKYSDFIMIVGFNEKHILRIIEELRVADSGVPFCIVDETIEELPLSIRIIPRVWFIRGHLLSESTYELANHGQAKMTIVLPVDDTVGGDCTTKAVVEFVEELNHDCRIVYLLNNIKNRKLFKENGKVSILQDSWVYLLAQECTDRYSSRVIEQITTNMHGENTITVRPNYYIGKTWKDLVIDALNSELQFTPLALIREGKILAPPTNSQVIGADDHISLVAYLNFNWLSFEKWAASQ